MGAPRSFLFVPADSPGKLAKGLASAADALIIDLEDSVADSRKAEARSAATSLLLQRGECEPGPQLWVRVNAWDTGLTLADLAACVRPGLRGIVLPKAGSVFDLHRLGHGIDTLEAREGLAPGSIGIVPVMTETAAAVLGAASFATAAPRVTGLLWGAEDLSADLGAAGNVDADGDWSFVYRHARAQCLLAAAASRVMPIDTLFADYRDEAGLERACVAARRDGFRAKVAIHPAQVEAINRLFAPHDTDLLQARAVVAAFAAQPGAGVIGIGGRMYDKPHLERARKLLATAPTGPHP